jgi:hypothetical protein
MTECVVDQCLDAGGQPRQEQAEEHAADVVGDPARSREEPVEGPEVLLPCPAASDLDHPRDAVPALA